MQALMELRLKFLTLGLGFCRNPSERWSAADALNHPWLRRVGASAADAGASAAAASRGVVQRIQRFGAFPQFKRTALESVAEKVCCRVAHAAQLSLAMPLHASAHELSLTLESNAWAY